MLALEVHINGKRRCLAGIANDGVVSAILSWVGRGHPERGLPKEDMSIRVGGLDSERREHMDWLQQELAAGDDVREMPDLRVWADLDIIVDHCGRMHVAGGHGLRETGVESGRQVCSAGLQPGNPAKQHSTIKG